MNIKQIKEAGFFINETKPRIDSLAFLSLRIALESYFSTYRSSVSYINYLYEDTALNTDNDSHYSLKYIENTSEAIFHFHHFVELILKDILRKKHDLLTINVPNKHELLYDLLFNNKDEAIKRLKIENQKQLEFSESLDRIVFLIKKKKIDEKKYDFIADAIGWLKDLNLLRNRIAHRGVFILRYKALDFLFGKFAFPFIKNVLALEEYHNKADWKYKLNAININPIEEIIKHIQSETYSLTKVSLLKEIGRASFENPINPGFTIYGYLNEKITQKSEMFAQNVLQIDWEHEVINCPICNTKSLVKSIDTFTVNNDETGETENVIQFIYKVKCYCCSFEIDDRLHDLGKMNLGIDDYWKEI